MSDSLSDTSAEGLTPLVHGARNRCFGCGQANPAGLKLEFAKSPEGAVVSKAVISDQYEGPPGCVHGGIIATMLDEAMSKANRVRGVTAMTRQMQVEYLSPVPSGAPIRIEGRVNRSEGRKHWAAATIQAEDGMVLARATGLFIAIRT
ncbi:PaaI family thioesterase [Acidicapsa acidisoli]|uniref:PaaI family thioesterase n=1 Tax=Acidicapsa acidisoli TaxID=1615681 RepID=UPI0021DFFC42|nr:PaaI family thioesterase [Acidicapsa acidisoli]